MGNTEQGRGGSSHLQSPGPRWQRRTPRPRLVVTVPSPPSPGHCPRPRPELRRPLPTAPPRGLRPKSAAPVQSAASRNRPYCVASSPRDKDAAGDGQVPSPGQSWTTQHKNAQGKQHVTTLSLPQPLVMKSTPGTSRPSAPQTLGRPACVAKSAPNPSCGERAQKATSEVAQASAILGALCSSGTALISIRARESQKACCGTQGRRHLLGPRKKRVVGLSHGPNLSGGAKNLKGFLGGRLACSLGLTKPCYTLSVLSRVDLRAMAQVAVTAVSWGSVPRRLASGPCSQAQLS